MGHHAMQQLPDPTSTTHEQERLYVLQSTGLLDTEAEEGFDRITRLASQLLGMPISLVTLMDSNRNWIKSRVGVELRESYRANAFCDYTIRGTEVMVVEDASRDGRFRDTPMVTEAGIRFYAGAPLVMPSGHALGALCVLDAEPRAFDEVQRRQLADLAALVVAQVDLHQSAGHVHHVTRLPNRAQLTADLNDRCRRTPGQRCTLVLLEVVGHEQLQAAVRAVGIAPLEVLLRDIAARLLALLAGQGPLYHVNDTRFAFVLDGDAVGEHEEIARSVLNRMSLPFLRAGVSVELEMRAGLADFAAVDEEAADALRRTTAAMHHAALGQRTLGWYEPDIDRRDRRAYAMLRDIPRAMADGEMRLVYQPKLNLRTRRYTGVEALLRWQHAKHGNLPPGEFIPLAENSPLIHLVTEWVLHTALAQLAVWKRRGLALSMAVNVSARNLEHPDFLRILRNACDVHGIAPRELHIECTENAALTGQATLAVLEEVRAMGVQVSLDDFGTGYCNLACLPRLPAELLKLDRSLVGNITNDTLAWKLVQSVIMMGQSLGYQLLAEGVETGDVFDRLAVAGCDAVQGYYLSPPLEVPDLEAFIQQHAGMFPAVRAEAAC